MGKNKFILKEGDYTEWLLDMEERRRERDMEERKRQRELEERRWELNNGPLAAQRQKEAEEQRKYQKRRSLNTKKGLPSSDSIINLEECDRYYDIGDSYYIIEWGGKWNVVSPKKTIIFPIWFDKIMTKGVGITPLTPLKVIYNYKYNLIIPKEGRLVYNIWFSRIDANFNKNGWALAYINRNHTDPPLMINIDGDIRHKDGTPYNPNETQNNLTNETKNISKKNTIRLTESDFKRVIYESVHKVLNEMYSSN